jgi:glycosyltransferase involved in cell wall biosynthesis
MRYQVGYNEPFRTVCKEAIFKGNNLGYFYVRLPWIILKYGKDIVHVEEEPYSLITFLSALWAKVLTRRFVFFTWENLFRKNFLFPYDLFERAVFKLADAAIAGNKDAGNILQRRGFKAKIVQFGQLGIDVPFTLEKEDPDFKARLRKGISFLVGFMGRVTKEKGIQTLIDAAARTPSDIGYVIIGRGDFQHGAKALVNRLGLHNRVHLLDTVTHEKVPAAMKSLDLLVLPSLTVKTWKEQFGQVLIEAMACGVPVVGSNSGAIPEVIGDAGLIFSEGDAQGLANAIMKIASNETLRRSFMEKEWKRVMENYTHQKIAAKTAQLYQEILRG